MYEQMRLLICGYSKNMNNVCVVYSVSLCPGWSTVHQQRLQLRNNTENAYSDDYGRFYNRTVSCLLGEQHGKSY